MDTTPLTTTQNAIINGDIITYVSVPSGEYTNATESADRQALAYVDNGAIFGGESDVLYYHRLTSAQKKNIVVTFDYNGGLDAQGWSGCQLTSDEAFAPACPAPTKKGHVLIGWKYAVDSNSNSLNMDGTTDYAGEAITENIRLIAQWKTVDHLVTIIHIVGENEYRESYYVPYGAEYTTSAETIEGYSQYSVSGDAANGIVDGDKTIIYTYTLDEEELEDPSTPMGPEPSEPDEEIEDEDVPMGSNPSDSTEVPKTGDNGVFMNMIIGALALVAMAVLVLNKKKYFIG